VCCIPTSNFYLKKLPSGAGRVVEIEVRTPDGTVVFFVDYAPFLFFSSFFFFFFFFFFWVFKKKKKKTKTKKKQKNKKTRGV
jgi:hypothetical protein